MTSSAAGRAREVREQLDAARRTAAGYQDMQRLMNRYAIERFLYRLGRSTYADQFILKGALLLAIYIPDAYRSTRDADFLAFGSFDPPALRRIFAELCAEPHDDGLTFDAQTTMVQPAGADREYPGYTVTIPARLGDANCDLRLDIGFGEAVVPVARRIDYPTILSMPSPRVRVYPLEAVIAEKFQAITYLGMSNTRMKDYHDLYEIARHCSLDGQALVTAVRATFQRRRTSIPSELPIGLSAAFYSAKARQRDWSAFLKRHGLPRRPDLATACRLIESMLLPVARAITSDEGFPGAWADGQWRTS